MGKFIFCEGKDDVLVIQELLKSLSSKLSLDIHVEEFCGKDNLRNFLSDALKRPEFSQKKVETIAIVRDADNDGNSAFQSVLGSLNDVGFQNCPSKPGIFSGMNPKIGVFIVASKDNRGAIEDLCLETVKTNPQFSCVDEYFRCVAEKSEKKSFSSKARVRVWMAGQKDFELFVGKAALEGYWDWNHQTFDSLKNFLKQV